MSRAGPVSRDLGTPVKRNKLHDNRASPVGRDLGIPANRAENFPCNRVNRASPENRGQQKICLRTNLLTYKLSIFSLNNKGVHKTMKA